MHSARAVRSLTLIVYFDWMGAFSRLLEPSAGFVAPLAAFLAFLHAAPFSLCEGPGG